MLGQVAGSSSVNQCEVSRQSQIDRELSELEFTANRLEDTLGRLASRIQPVLHYSALNEAGKNAPDEVIAPLADRIRSTRKRIESYELALSNLISAIEI